MGLGQLFRRSDPAQAAGQALYRALVLQARSPGFYRDLGAPDTIEGRFEVYALHLALLVLRLRGQGTRAEAASQALFDAFIRGLEDGLRELGVGDTGVSKRMKKLGQSVYGRLQGYDGALAALPDRAALDALIARTVLAPPEDGSGPAEGLDSGPWGDYVVRARAALAALPDDQLLAGSAAWPPAT
jgi:cytochrome b pre-mRNA-processing protein 3